MEEGRAPKIIVIIVAVLSLLLLLLLLLFDGYNILWLILNNLAKSFNNEIWIFFRFLDDLNKTFFGFCENFIYNFLSYF